MRAEERKRLLRKELDEQARIKKEKAKKAKEDDMAYDRAQAEHLKLLNAKEEEKIKKLKDKVLAEKEMRDTHLKKVEH